MNSVLFSLPMAAVVTVFPSVAASQQPPAQPSHEQQKLGVFVGTWSYEVTGVSQGTRSSGTWTVEPAAGGHIYLAKEISRREGEAFPVEGLAILGYKPQEKQYSWCRFFSNGWSDEARGSVSGDSWQWVFEDVVVEGKPTRARLTAEFARSDHFTFTWERSTDGGPWEVTAKGTATRNR